MSGDTRVVPLRTKYVRIQDAVCLLLLPDFLQRLIASGTPVALSGVRDDVKEIWSSTMSAVHWAYQQLDSERCPNCPHGDSPRDGDWHFMN